MIFLGSPHGTSPASVIANIKLLQMYSLNMSNIYSKSLGLVLIFYGDHTKRMEFKNTKANVLQSMLISNSFKYLPSFNFRSDIHAPFKNFDIVFHILVVLKSL